MANINKETFEIIKEQSKGNLMTALENSIMRQVSCTRIEANMLANNLLDIIDAFEEFDNERFRQKESMEEKNRKIRIAIEYLALNQYRLPDDVREICRNSLKMQLKIIKYCDEHGNCAGCEYRNSHRKNDTCINDLISTI